MAIRCALILLLSHLLVSGPFVPNFPSGLGAMDRYWQWILYIKRPKKFPGILNAGVVLMKGPWGWS